MPAASAAAITSLSLSDPPGCMTGCRTSCQNQHFQPSSENGKTHQHAATEPIVRSTDLPVLHCCDMARFMNRNMRRIDTAHLASTDANSATHLSQRRQRLTSRVLLPSMRKAYR